VSNYLAILGVILPNNASMTLTIDKFGRVLIPKTLRQHLMIEPGDELKVEIVPDAPHITLAAKPKPGDVQVVYTDWGFPVIEGGEPFPDNFDTVEYLKEGYDEYHKSRFGV